jgi:LiaF transmembrane domain
MSDRFDDHIGERIRDRVRDRSGYEARAAGNARLAFRQMLPRLIFGGWLAVLGVIFTLDNVGVLDAREWISYWPIALVALGVGLIASSRTQGELVGGAVWTAVGGAFLLDRLHWLPFRVWDFWPLLLVGAGASLVLRGMRPRITSGDESSTLHAFAMMSGVTRKSASIGFEGGTLNAIMGGVEVDLRNAQMVRRQAVLDCFAFWGGIDIKVPPGWTVHSRIFPFMGGFDDKTTPPAPEDSTGELVITGFVCMGGVSVKN